VKTPAVVADLPRGSPERKPVMSQEATGEAPPRRTFDEMIADLPDDAKAEIDKRLSKRLVVSAMMLRAEPLIEAAFAEKRQGLPPIARKASNFRLSQDEVEDLLCEIFMNECLREDAADPTDRA
jgi:hypothetical protein